VRANAVAGVSPSLPADQRTADRWFNTAAFVTPPAFTFGNAGRNSVYGPGLSKTDVALQREFTVRQDVRVEFRAEAFTCSTSPTTAHPNVS